MGAIDNNNRERERLGWCYTTTNHFTIVYTYDIAITIIKKREAVCVGKNGYCHVCMRETAALAVQTYIHTRRQKKGQ